MRLKTFLSINVLALAALAVAGQQPAPSPMMGEKKMDESMMAHHKEMMAKMEAMDSKLDDLVKKMNAAKGNSKVDATAAVVNELIAQRKQMREHMMAMQPEMMKHMMEHMQTGMMKGMMESMSECPMMKGMAGPPDEPKKPATEEHSKHHPE
jgi:outer membrane murein-binding lipoprotein Lpp